MMRFLFILLVSMLALAGSGCAHKRVATVDNVILPPAQPPAVPVARAEYDSERALRLGLESYVPDAAVAREGSGSGGRLSPVVERVLYFGPTSEGAYQTGPSREYVKLRESEYVEPGVILENAEGTPADSGVSRASGLLMPEARMENINALGSGESHWVEGPRKPNAGVVLISGLLERERSPTPRSDAPPGAVFGNIARMRTDDLPDNIDYGFPKLRPSLLDAEAPKVSGNNRASAGEFPEDIVRMHGRGDFRETGIKVINGISLVRILSGSKNPVRGVFYPLGVEDSSLEGMHRAEDMIKGMHEPLEGGLMLYEPAHGGWGYFLPGVLPGGFSSSANVR